jgi:hypothetical protein
MFVHQVYFWLKNPDNTDEYTRLLSGIQGLAYIEPKTLFHAGVPASTNRPVIDRSYSFSLLVIFDNLEEHDAYQQHPAHLKFVEECSALWSKVVIYDAVDPK